MLRAVIVGINDYPGAPLAGCINDAEDVIAYLSRRGAPDENIVPIYDGRATKREIVAALEALIARSTSGDHLLFHYSGHGSQIPSSSADEADAFDECLCPVDFSWDAPATALRDKELAALLAAVPADVAMTVVLDSCHSGDMRRGALASSMVRTQRSYPMPLDLQRRARVARKRELRPPVRILAANTVVVSACQSSESAADTAFGGRANGAFTYFWYDALARTAGATLDTLLAACTGPLARYAMHPMLDGGADLLQKQQFLVDPPPFVAAPTPTVPRTRTLVFEKSFSVEGVGAVEVRVADGDGEFLCEVTRSPTQWIFPVSGNVTHELLLERDTKLLIAIDRWTVTGTTPSFALSVRLVASPSTGAETCAPASTRKNNGTSRDVDPDAPRAV